MRTSFAWTMPAMPSLIVRRYRISASMTARVSIPPWPGEYLMPGMTSCGCASTTWYCSMKASSASFQLTGSRQAYHHSARIDSTFQASRTVANGSMHCRSGGASSLRLIQAHPPQVSHRTGVRSRSFGARLCSANVFFRGTKVFRPSWL